MNGKDGHSNDFSLIIKSIVLNCSKQRTVQKRKQKFIQRFAWDNVSENKLTTRRGVAKGYIYIDTHIST